jgi:peptidoglycan/LPS O-acetylase OafA/YrhL
LGDRSSHISSQYRPALDGLRGLAACIVIVSHVSNALNLWGGLLGGGGGQVGVMLFFVLSGYLMGFLYLHRPFNTAEVWNYAVHRGARILPLFYAAVIFTLALDLIGRLIGIPLQLYTIDSLPLMLTLVKGSSVFWTIPIEIQFYAIFAVAWGAYALFRKVALAAMLVLGVFVLTATPAPPFTVIYYTPYFLCGVIVSQILPLVHSRLSTPPWSVALASGFPLFLLMYPRITMTLFGTEFGLWTNPACLALAASCLIATLCSPTVGAILSSRPMVHLGKVSFALYLLHKPTLLLLQRTTSLEHWPVLFLVVTLLITIAVSSVVHRLFESPMRLAINERFSKTRLRLFPERVTQVAETATGS